jgi:cbb3-type cytochrome oxidase subunit 3
MLRLIRSLMVFAEQLAMIEEAANAMRRLVLHACLAVGAAFLLFCSVACAAAGLWIWADRRFGPVHAPLLVALVFAALALCLVATMVFSRRAARRTRADRAARAVTDLANAPMRLLDTALQGFLAGLATRRAADRKARGSAPGPR